MGLFDEIEKQAEKQGGRGKFANEAEKLIEQQGGIDKVANEAEKAAGGKHSKYGKAIEEGAGLYKEFEHRKNQGR